MHFDALIGWIAALLTLTAFSQRSMVHLRLAAIGANLAFITYGLLGELVPIVALHVTLLPCNLLRLAQLLLDPQHRTGTICLDPTLQPADGGRSAAIIDAIAQVREHAAAFTREVGAGAGRSEALRLQASLASLEASLSHGAVADTAWCDTEPAASDAMDPAARPVPLPAFGGRNGGGRVS